MALFVNIDTYSPLAIGATFTSYFVFIGLFIVCLRQHGNQVIMAISGIIALAALTSGYHPTANSLFCYAAFVSSFYFNSRLALRLLMANFTAIITAAMVFQLFHVYYLIPALLTSAGLPVYGYFLRKDKFNQQVIETKNEQIEHLATIAERERIARDMHDLLGHSLSSLALKSELAATLIDKDKTTQAQAEITAVAALARSTLTEIRHAVSDYKQRGVVKHINQQLQQLKHFGFNIQSQVVVSVLPATVESSLILIAKEALTNVLNHSQGTHVKVTLKNTEKTVVLAIQDNGHTPNVTSGNGIVGIQQRVKALDGDFTFNLDDGVKLLIVIPITHAGVSND